MHRKHWLYSIILIVLVTFKGIGQQMEEPNYYRATGVKLGFMDIRGEATSTLSNFYVGGEAAFEYSSSFPYNAAWHYYAEISYYVEVLNPELQIDQEIEFRAVAQGINLQAGLRWYVGNEAEFLKIKYDRNKRSAAIPWLSLGGGAGMVGASVTDGQNVGYTLSEGLQVGYFAEGMGGLDFFIHEDYKISTYVGLRNYFQDNLDALIGDGPFPDLLVRIGVGVHYLF